MSADLSTGQQLQQVFGDAHVNGFNAHSQHIFHRLHQCHTAAMGMHHYKCDDKKCNHLHQQYHSYGNPPPWRGQLRRIEKGAVPARLVTHSGGPARLVIQAGIENLTAQLFPTSYYHMVFTVPHEFNALMLGNRKAMFTLLFQAASQILLQFSADEQYLGAACGITAVLHIWGQYLSFHPHLNDQSGRRTCIASLAAAA